ncbi:MAG: Holliday junction resolvase RuvX [Acidobacteria bacterium]|nr:Holliday junction resolvase RuvX [Acidobacteriota bacterium]
MDRPLSLSNDDASQARHSGEGRVLAIDLGTRRMGLAVSDPLRLIAQGLPTYHRQNKRQDLGRLSSLVREYEVSLIVVGNPVNMNGTEGTQSAKAREFADELEQRLDVAVQMWDERLTSVEANRVLDESGVDRNKRAEVVDRVAAVLLLENFLDSHRTPPSPAPESEG